jgi:hypothetical protein
MIVLQKEGTTGRCWMGVEDGTFYPIGVVTTIASTVGTDTAQVVVGNLSGATYAAGTPVTFLDYIRVVNGNGNYLP